MAVYLADRAQHNNPLYPVVAANDIQGFSIVDTVPLRTSISIFKRELGHIVNVRDTGVFKYVHATSTADVDWADNANWFDLSGSGNFVPTTRKVNNLTLSSDITITTSDIANCAYLNPVTGKLDESLVPDLAVSQYLGNVANEAAMLALVGKQGDWCIRDDETKVYIVTAQPSSILANWQAIVYPGSSAVWGLITGSILNQTDLITYIRESTYQASPVLSIGDSQNFLLYTEEFTNAAWVRSNCNASPPDAANNPALYPNAEYITATSNNGYVEQTVAENGTGNYTFSIYLKSNSGNIAASLLINSSAENGTPLAIQIKDSWERFSVTQNFTLANTTKTVRLTLTNSASVANVWGAQLEQSSYKTSYSQLQTNTATQNTRAYILRAAPYTLFEMGYLTSVNRLNANSGANVIGDLNIARSDIRTTFGKALNITNPTGATNSIPVQMSPTISLEGNVWDNSAAQPFRWDIDTFASSSASPTSKFNINYSYSNGARSNFLSLKSDGWLNLKNNITLTKTKSVSLSDEIVFDSTNFFKVSYNSKANIDANTLTSNTNILYVNNDGKVAIGQNLSTAPIDLLEIRSSVANLGLTLSNNQSKSLFSIVRNQALTLNDIIGTVSFGNSTTHGAEFNIIASENWSGSANGANIFIASNTNGSNVVSNKVGIYNDGKVAIGNITPTSLLDVNGDVEVLNTASYYYGDPTTNGSYRTRISGSDLVVENRLAGVWTLKTTLSTLYSSTQIDTFLAAKANKITSPTAGRLWQSDATGHPTETSYLSSQVVQLSSISMSDINVGESKILTAVKQGDGSAALGTGVSLLSDFLPSGTINTLEYAIFVDNAFTISGANDTGQIGYKGQRGYLSDGSIILCTNAVINASGSATFIKCTSRNSLNLSKSNDINIANLLNPARVGGNTDTGWDTLNNVLIISTLTCEVGTFFTEGSGYIYYCYDKISTAYYWRRIGQPNYIQKMITTSSHPTLTGHLAAYDWSLGFYTTVSNDETSYHEQYYNDGAYTYTKFDTNRFYRTPMGIQTTKVTLTSAQIAALNTTPITLLSAPSAEFLHLIEGVCLSFKYGTSVFVVGLDSDLMVRYSGGAYNIIKFETTGFLDQASSQISHSRLSAIASATANISGKAVEIANIGTVISGNASLDNSLDVIFTYKTIKL